MKNSSTGKGQKKNGKKVDFSTQLEKAFTERIPLTWIDGDKKLIVKLSEEGISEGALMERFRNNQPVEVQLPNNSFKMVADPQISLSGFPAS